MKLNLGFGNPVCVRKAFLDSYRGNLIVTTNDTLMNKFDYPEYNGDLELIEETRKIIKRQTGQEYKHTILTNGATGAINVVLSTYRMMGYDTCLTRKAPFYLRYPTMVEQSGLKHTQDNHRISGETVVLLDFPSNPLNLLTPVICSRRPHER